LLIDGLGGLAVSEIVISPLIIVPFVFKYYMGGLINAKEAAEQKRIRKQSVFYNELMGTIVADEHSVSDTALLKPHNIPDSEHTNYKMYLHSAESEMEAILAFLFLFYKEYISSQDVESCVFEPSCSVYTIRAIEEQGTIIGLLDGFDRLLRCHMFVNRKDYPYNHESRKYHDPH